MTTATDELKSTARTAPVSSVLADLGSIPLEEMQAANDAALSATLQRVLPAAETQQVRVAAFNSGI